MSAFGTWSPSHILSLLSECFSCRVPRRQRSHGRSHVLHQTLMGFVQRKDVTVMAKALPKDVVREEIVLNVNLSDEQQKLTRKIFREARYIAQADGW